MRVSAGTTRPGEGGGEGGGEEGEGEGEERRKEAGIRAKDKCTDGGE